MLATEVKRKRRGQLGNRNAVGHGAPLGNKNAYKHGLRERWPPKYTSETYYREQAVVREQRRQEQLWEDVAQVVDLEELRGFDGTVRVVVTVYPNGCREVEEIEFTGWLPEDIPLNPHRERGDESD